MRNMKDLLSEISATKAILENDPLWTSIKGFEYAFGQLKLFEERSRQCDFPKFGGNMNEYIVSNGIPAIY